MYLHLKLTTTATMRYDTTRRADFDLAISMVNSIYAPLNVYPGLVYVYLMVVSIFAMVC